MDVNDLVSTLLLLGCGLFVVLLLWAMTVLNGE